MKLYKHSNGKTSILPEHIPEGWEVFIRADDFETVWRRIEERKDIEYKVICDETNNE